MKKTRAVVALAISLLVPGPARAETSVDLGPPFARSSAESGAYFYCPQGAPYFGFCGDNVDRRDVSAEPSVGRITMAATTVAVGAGVCPLCSGDWPLGVPNKIWLAHGTANLYASFGATLDLATSASRIDLTATVEGTAKIIDGHVRAYLVPYKPDPNARGCNYGVSETLVSGRGFFDGSRVLTCTISPVAGGIDPGAVDVTIGLEAGTSAMLEADVMFSLSAIIYP